MPGRADAVLTGLAVRVAAITRRPEPGGPPHPVSVRARGGQGQWIVLHGELITGPDGQAQGIGVVIEPARHGPAGPGGRYRLTGREQEVVSCIFAGLSTREISGRLHISTHTVQDHLRAVFSKVGSTVAAN
jgi:DNA-binding CsgD family transcriptional regulator